MKEMNKKWTVVSMSDSITNKIIYYTVICEEGEKMYGIGDGNEPIKFKTKSEGKNWITENKDKEVWKEENTKSMSI